MNLPEECFADIVPAPEELVSRKKVIDAVTAYALKMQEKFGYKLTREQCREAVYGVLEAIPAAIPPSEPALYGYHLDYLIAFATACRRAGVNDDDLKTFANNLDFAFQIATDEIRRLQMEAAAKVMGGMSND